MIQIQQRPLNDTEVKSVRAWLASSNSEVFKRYLSGKAAEFAAEAANKLVSGEENEKIDAEEAAQNARKYIAATDIISECQSPGFEFLTVQLTPKPTSTTE